MIISTGQLAAASYLLGAILLPSVPTMPEEEDQDQGQGEVIVTPHDHDVLSGRGNFVNYHKGNEHFRALVRKHKVAYVACPKAQKGKFSKLIVDEIKALDPPGRFLKQDPATKLWSDIGEKKALDKTRQALREGAPEIMKELNDDDSTGDDKARDAATSPQNGPRSLTRVPINVRCCSNAVFPFNCISIH
jgi:hypothetical protein